MSRLIDEFLAGRRTRRLMTTEEIATLGHAFVGNRVCGIAFCSCGAAVPMKHGVPDVSFFETPKDENGTPCTCLLCNPCKANKAP